jgi:hypothetical protein
MLSDKVKRLDYIRNKNPQALLSRIIASVLIHRPTEPIDFVIHSLESGIIRDKVEVISVAHIPI